MDTNTASNAVPIHIPTPATTLFQQEAPEWARLLLKEIESTPKNLGKAAVALRLGVGRAYVSRVVATLEGRSSGFPNGVPEAFQDRVIARLKNVAECPQLKASRPVSECVSIALAPPPTHNPQQMREWGACQRCPHKPAQSQEKE